jgi:hypothetical protein
LARLAAGVAWTAVVDRMPGVLLMEQTPSWQERSRAGQSGVGPAQAEGGTPVS